MEEMAALQEACRLLRAAHGNGLQTYRAVWNILFAFLHQLHMIHAQEVAHEGLHD